MTHRSEANPPSAIELAVAEVTEALNRAIALSWQANRVPMEQPQFRRTLALYFHDKSLTDWANDFGIPDPSDPADRPQRI